MTRSPSPRRTLLSLAGTGLAAALLLTGCSGGSGGSAASEDSAVAGGNSASDGLANGVPDSTARSVQAQSAFGARQGGPEVQQALEISHGQVLLRSTGVADARVRVLRVVDRYAGEVTSDQTDSDDDGRVLAARLVVRVPAARFEDAMEALRGVGRLVHASSDTRDVTTKVIDTRSRLEAQRRSVHRVTQLLARAQNLRDIVLIENELSQRQAALDSLEQQAAYLSDQTARSTIAVEIDRAHHAAPKEETDHTGFLAGLAAGWHGLTAVAVALATALGALLPFTIVLAVLALLAWPLRRVVRRTRPPAAAE